MNPVQHTSSLYARVYPGDLRAAELACLKHRREKAGSSDYSPTDPETRTERSCDDDKLA